MNAFGSRHRPHERLILSAALSAFCVGAVAHTASATQAFQESGGQVVMDAEHYDSTIPRNGQDWVFGSSQVGYGYSGTGYLQALPDTGVNQSTTYVTTSPELVYNVQFSTTGTYYFWVRGNGPTTNDDSVHGGLDGVGPATADKITYFQQSWTWSMSRMDNAPATVTVSSPGLHTIHLWMQKDGFLVDKILLRTSSSTTAPSGTGPAESPRITVAADIAPPTGTVSINNGAASTTTVSVTLTLSATDDSGTVSQMQCSNDNVTYSTPEAYATTKSWSLSTGDGTKTVSVKFKDPTGNWSAPVNDTILLDTTPPVVTITSPSDGAVLGAP